MRLDEYYLKLNQAARLRDGDGARALRGFMEAQIEMWRDELEEAREKDFMLIRGKILGVRKILADLEVEEPVQQKTGGYDG